MNEKLFFNEHRWEIIFAAIFAVIALLVWEIFRHPFSKMYRKFVSPKLSKACKKIKNRGEEVIHEAEILNSIQSHFADKVPPQYIADAIKKHNSLSINRRFHYADISKKYHIFRRFKLFPILNGDEAFFTEICRAMSEGINFRDVNLTLCIKKGPNNLFARKFSDNYPGRIRAHALTLKENKKFFKKEPRREIAYEEGDALVGTNVILLESLLIFPETIIEHIKWVHEQGAHIKKVVILFNGTNSPIDLSACGISAEDVIIGVSVNLGFASAESCRCHGKGRLKILKYNEY